jgi:hypothetical protein
LIILEKRNKQYQDKFKDFEKNFEHYITEHKKNPKKKENKPVRVIKYIIM